MTHIPMSRLVVMVIKRMETCFLIYYGYLILTGHSLEGIPEEGF